MLKRGVKSWRVLICVWVWILVSAAVWAQIEPDNSGPAQLEFEHQDLKITSVLWKPGQLPPQAAARARGDLAALGGPTASGRLDFRGGRWATLTMARPLIPGRGLANGLSWSGLGRRKPSTGAALGSATADALRNYLQANAGQLRLDMNEVAGSRVSVLRDGDLVQLYSPRVFSGIPVRGSYLTAVVSKGNLTLIGTALWGDIDVSTTPDGTEDEAWAAIEAYADPYTATGAWRKSELLLVPSASGNNLGQPPFSLGYTYRLPGPFVPLSQVRRAIGRGWSTPTPAQCSPSKIQIGIKAPPRGASRAESIRSPMTASLPTASNRQAGRCLSIMFPPPGVWLPPTAAVISPTPSRGTSRRTSQVSMSG